MTQISQKAISAIIQALYISNNNNNNINVLVKCLLLCKFCHFINSGREGNLVVTGKLLLITRPHNPHQNCYHTYLVTKQVKRKVTMLNCLRIQNKKLSC